jgi:hypothetical protein
MIKEIKYFIFTVVIIVFIFFTARHYFSEAYKKKSYRSLINIDKKIILYAENLPVLKSNTKNIIEYVKDDKTKKKKKYFFWELISKND